MSHRKLLKKLNGVKVLRKPKEMTKLPKRKLLELRKPLVMLH